MTTVTKNHLSQEQVSAWLRGLLTIAWADGHFDPEEKELIAALTQDELAPLTNLGNLDPISPEELASALGEDKNNKENFLRTAVMMALANGIYSAAEAKVVHDFHHALGLEIEALKALESTLCDLEQPHQEKAALEEKPPVHETHPDILHPIKDWLDGMDIHDPRVARFICKTIPPQCPFERDIKLFGHKIVHIPPMCKLNPLYEQLVGLRFRSLSYLADECGEDVSPYI
ncbi:MAG: nitrogenase [Gomphosphaeria aponina SAG 52.96 = DSM 107014]|uniref:Nitrogenase n=1 Tax=Gomphosphaeria aponina SAG 52.96 = DSM 107014 TaxID=1521640 RepID=A0A941GWC7_9CHRO|nr:nitrogenase [Gomphosphaeria aponina SAG 52.96 = DSM 107014]